MAYTGQISGRQRALSGGGALLAVVAVGLGLALGLDLDVVRRASEAINAIAIPAPPPSRPTVPSSTPSEKASGSPAAANRHAKAAAATAPHPKLPPIVPPVTAAPRPGSGNDASAARSAIATIRARRAAQRRAATWKSASRSSRAAA